MIKRAHDLNASVIELHSHPFSKHAEFSPSDLSGFSEFIPHVWWRLKGRPYAAIVLAPTGFDSLAWLENPTTPNGLLQIQAGSTLITPTGFTYSALENRNASQSL
jgi:hypothetical protein